MEPVSKTESKLLGVSVRGWIAAMILGTVCFQSFMGQPIVEPLYSLSIGAMGWYFGQKEKAS
jgi:hypothetical protein